MIAFSARTHSIVLTEIPAAEKQTVEFNINIRAQFKKTVRARMGEQ